jgi:hypothetical protein
MQIWNKFWTKFMFDKQSSACNCCTSQLGRGFDCLPIWLVQWGRCILEDPGRCYFGAALHCICLWRPINAATDQGVPFLRETSTVSSIHTQVVTGLFVFWFSVNHDDYSWNSLCANVVVGITGRIGSLFRARWLQVSAGCCRGWPPQLTFVNSSESIHAF